MKKLCGTSENKKQYKDLCSHQVFACLLLGDDALSQTPSWAVPETMLVKQVLL